MLPLFYVFYHYFNLPFRAWEQRKVSDYAINTYGGGTPKTNVPEYWSGEIPWIQSSDLLISNLFNVIPKKYITELAVKSSATKFIPANSIAIVSRVGVGKLVFMPFEYTTSQDFLSLSNLQVDSNFGVYSIYMMLQKELKNIQGTSIKGITKTDLLEKNINKPLSREEQQKIGAFFKQLDNTITLHQRKLDALKLMKKGFLQQMFPNNEEEIPNVRFTDFDAMWEQRKLKSITEKITRKNKELESTLPLTISAQDGLIDQNEYFNKIVASRNIRGYFLVKNGEFAYNKSYSKGYPWGVVKRLDNYDMGVLSTLYIIFKPIKINSDFLTKYFDSTYWYCAVSQFATEGARNHGLLNIAASDFFEIELNIPLNNEEQKKIGLFFQQLENTLILHQNKLEKLSILKKTYLKKMFI
ncbi:TPA: restriction endonuclease subunit S [Listeria innocua]